MDSNIITALRKERRELATKLAKLDALLVAYGEIPNEELKESNIEEKPNGSEPLILPEIPVSSDDIDNEDLSKTKRIKAAVIAFLNEHGPQHRKTILDYLTKRGLMGEEKDPMQRLAIYLSGMRNVIVSDGAGNFRLKTHRVRLI
jgi:hypothetical protein